MAAGGSGEEKGSNVKLDQLLEAGLVSIIAGLVDSLPGLGGSALLVRGLAALVVRSK